MRRDRRDVDIRGVAAGLWPPKVNRACLESRWGEGAKSAKSAKSAKGAGKALSAPGALSVLSALSALAACPPPAS
jgi:hypothetical protein